MADGEKTEQATPKKRRDERKKGNVLQSKDVTTAIFIFVIFFALSLLMPYMYEKICQAFYFCIQTAGSIKGLTISDASEILRILFSTVLLTVLPILSVTIIVNTSVSMFQTKMLFATEKLKPKFSNLNPLSGLKKMVSLRALVDLVKNLLKIVIIMALIYTSVRQAFYDLPRLFDMEAVAVCAYAGDKILALVWKIGLAFLIIAVLDYFYQRYDHEKKMRMTKHEVKQEYKQMEGDPLVKSHRRQEQMKMSRSRMMQNVGEADVVIRNPSHFAVALTYNKEIENSAPIVVAKGQDYTAQKIIEMAMLNQVPLLENPPLARNLYHTVEIGQEILPEQYQAVAEVFAWVYQFNAEGKKA